jgi:hypothetical protein
LVAADFRAAHIADVDCADCRLRQRLAVFVVGAAMFPGYGHQLAQYQMRSRSKRTAHATMTVSA